MSENWFSDEALRKQAALAALPDGEIKLSMLLGIYEPRTQPTDAERCTCCGVDARDGAGGGESHGKRWCSICIGRGHDE